MKLALGSPMRIHAASRWIQNTNRTSPTTIATSDLTAVGSVCARELAVLAPNATSSAPTSSTADAVDPARIETP